MINIYINPYEPSLGHDKSQENHIINPYWYQFCEPQSFPKLEHPLVRHSSGDSSFQGISLTTHLYGASAA